MFYSCHCFQLNFIHVLFLITHLIADLLHRAFMYTPKIYVTDTTFLLPGFQTISVK